MPISWRTSSGLWLPLLSSFPSLPITACSMHWRYGETAYCFMRSEILNDSTILTVICLELTQKDLASSVCPLLDAWSVSLEASLAHTSAAFETTHCDISESFSPPRLNNISMSFTSPLSFIKLLKNPLTSFEAPSVNIASKNMRGKNQGYFVFMNCKMTAVFSLSVVHPWHSSEDIYSKSWPSSSANSMFSKVLVKSQTRVGEIPEKNLGQYYWRL